MTSAGKPKVLVVDDHPAQRMALSLVLADLDVDVVEATSGREALRCLLQQEFAVILLDVNMPGLDGFETAALIRARRSSEHTPIIFVTAYSDNAHVERGYLLGAVDYILAPIQPNILRSKVSVFLDLYRKTDQIRRQREALWRYAEQLQQLSQSSLAINSARSVSDLVPIVTDSAARIIGAEQASMSVLQDDGRTMTVTHLSEKYGGYRHTWTTPATTSPLALGIERPLRMTSAELKESPTWRSAPELGDGVPLRGWLAAPLANREAVKMGILQLSEKRDGEFTAEDEGILVQLAQMASIAIENTVASEAREANRLKDEFLGVLSHELRTPLQAMITWVSVLRKESIDAATTARGLAVIERSARAQAQLIGDLLDVSRIIRGQLRLENGPVDLVKLIGLVIETLKPEAGAKSVQIVWTPPGGDYHVVGDATRLQQVVWNLLSNAIKFTPDRGQVEIRLLHEGVEVVLQVIDTGRGIPPEFLPHIFERFRQADSSTERHHGGLGLGLAIVRHLVELHGGAVTADNMSRGSGAVFTVRLPRQPQAIANAARVLGVDTVEVKNNSSWMDGRVVRLDGIRVVLVEDEGDTRECLSTALQLLGARVVAVTSAADALAALDSERPDVLLSDVGMPGHDGYALIRQVRARELDERRTRLPAAALTAYVRPEDRDGALTAGFDAHVGKPVEALELARVVQRLSRRTPDL